MYQVSCYRFFKSGFILSGISVEGTVIIERKDANKKFYGKEVTATQILSGEVETPPVVANVLYEVIKRAESRKTEDADPSS